MRAVSEESLLAGLGSGDPEAARIFIRRFQGRVFGLALTIVGDRQTAEEIAQETFVRAWRCADTYDPRRGRVATWVLSIARNLSTDLLRLRRCEPIDPLQLESLDCSLSVSVHALDDHSIHEGCRRIRVALDELPIEQRRALLLAKVYGCTTREISEMEEVPLGTAKKRVRTALLKLRSLLEVRDEL